MAHLWCVFWFSFGEKNARFYRPFGSYKPYRIFFFKYGHVQNIAFGYNWMQGVSAWIKNVSSHKSVHGIARLFLHRFVQNLLDFRKSVHGNYYEFRQQLVVGSIRGDYFEPPLLRCSNYQTTKFALFSNKSFMSWYTSNFSDVLPLYLPYIPGLTDNLHKVQK